MGSVNSQPLARSEYGYADTRPAHTNAYLWPLLERILAGHLKTGERVFDLGCGNGSLAGRLAKLGYCISGVDPSTSGIERANREWPELDLRIGSAYDDLFSQFGTFPAVVSLEVVEHVYAPREYARCVAHLLQPNGIAVISTPYHGYWKNLALALTGKLDGHFTALWDHGHIKFWSVRTLSQLLQEAGLQVESVYRVGRVPILAKSMMLVARKR